MSPGECPYRSPKQAAREEAIRLSEGLAPRNLEASSPYDSLKHIEYPRMVETKPSRFADTAVLLDRLADGLFEGEGDEVRLSELRRLRTEGRKMFTAEDDPDGLLQLEEDWSDMDYQASIDQLLTDPRNQTIIDQYGEIMLDLTTDPNAIEPSFEGRTLDERFDGPEFLDDFTTENIHNELRMRLNPGSSIESAISGRALVRWALDALPPEVRTSDDKRRFMIDLIPFFEKLSELEIEHLHEYYLKNDGWIQNDITAKKAGVSLIQDAAGQYEYRLTQRRNRPERTEGKPIGCPAGFTFESMAEDGLGKVIKKPTVIHRMLTAFVNEAYDRGVLD